jgi:hypothetical protein
MLTNSHSNAVTYHITNEGNITKDGKQNGGNEEGSERNLSHIVVPTIVTVATVEIPLHSSSRRVAVKTLTGAQKAPQVVTSP